MTHFLTLLFLSLCTYGIGISQNWIGGTGNWNVASNWDTNTIPDGTADVEISGASSVVTIPAGYAALSKGIRISVGASLAIEATGSLQIQNTDRAGIVLGARAGRFTPGGPGTINNLGTLNCNINIGFGAISITNNSTIINHSSGVINLNNTANSSRARANSGRGIAFSGISPNSLVNSGCINIGPDITSEAIYQGRNTTATFTNNPGGQVKILGVGASFNAIANDPSSTLTFTNNGDMCIQGVTPPGIDIEATVTLAGSNTPQSGGCTTTGPVPTLSQWGLIILALLMGVFATLALQSKFTLVEASSTRSISMVQIPCDRSYFAKILAILLAGVIGIFALAILGCGYELTEADVPGVLLASPIAAYLLHLWVRK